MTPPSKFEVPLRTCGKCQQAQELHNFYKSNRTVCKVCVLAAKKVQREAKRARVDSAITYAEGQLPWSGFNSAKDYPGHELAPFDSRPGANDALRLPSRMGNVLHYRDGSTARLD